MSSRKGARRTGREARPTTAPPSSGARLDDGGEAEVSSARARLLDDVPTVWLDRLLVAVLDLPVQDGEEAVVRAMVAALSSILPTHAVGACVVVEQEGGRRAPVVVCKTPDRICERPAGAHPTRVFPGISHELAVPVPGQQGSTIHLASDDDELGPDGSPGARMVERAAMALGRLLPKARAAAALHNPQRGVAVFDQRMIRADKLATFGQVAAGVVHELNNPLTSIVAYTDYLVRKADGGGRDADDVDRLRRISEAANRMLRLTRDLVNYARPSMGVPAQVPLHGVIDRAIAFCEHVLGAANMRVERRYCADGATINAVSEQLVQVFVNLITNAAQAAPASDARLVVATSLRPAAGPRARPDVVVVVEDNGTGIAPEHLPHVFVPFFTTKSERNGTGLGLSIVKSIVQGHEGDVHVESRSGQGTRFIVELPAI